MTDDAPTLVLLWIVALPLCGGLLCLATGRLAPRLPPWVALCTLAADGVLLASLWRSTPPLPTFRARWWVGEVDVPWIPSLGASLHLGLDGLSLLLCGLTLLLGAVAVIASVPVVSRRTGPFFLCVLASLTGILGVFAALDLLVLYVFWELMLVPVYFLIAVWGHEDRGPASVKFFIFTQAGGLLMLLSILGLVFVHQTHTGQLTFDYTVLAAGRVQGPLAFWLMVGFFAAFAVKLPAAGLHTWLPDAHTQAPTAGSVILAGLLLKTGAYGVLRFCLPLFPGPSSVVAPAAMAIGAAGILYGALQSLGQRDLKRLVAYTSVSHMGFVLLGAYAANPTALQGVVVQLLAHGLSTGGLFVLSGILEQRLHTRDIRRMGGLRAHAPWIGRCGLALALASLGLPGLGNFVAEVLVLAGAFAQYPGLTAVATAGLVLATVYALAMVQRVFHGPNSSGATATLEDLDQREGLSLGVLVLLLVLLGLFPRPVIDTVAPVVELIHGTARVGLAAHGG